MATVRKRPSANELKRWTIDHGLSQWHSKKRQIMLLAARPATPLGVPEAAGSRAEKKPRLVCWWGDARRAGRRVLRLLPIIGVLSSVPWSGLAQETQELAKQAQNPIANLISVPLQHNFNFGVGPEEDLQYVLNI